MFRSRSLVLGTTGLAAALGLYSKLSHAQSGQERLKHPSMFVAGIDFSSCTNCREKPFAHPRNQYINLVSEAISIAKPAVVNISSQRGNHFMAFESSGNTY